MADRQDIDALIVGALYGELDAADRARLETHLTSHPEDRAALEALERTRAAVRRGIADLPSSEPSPAISTLLLAEAARLAPVPAAAATATAAEPGERTDDRSDGLWTRFLTWLRPVALHPAFAGAAALILVVGTATALISRGRGDVTEPSHDQAAAPRKAHDVQPPPPEGAAGSIAARDPATTAPAAADEADRDAYRVDLADTGNGADHEAAEPEPSAQAVTGGATPARRKASKGGGAEGRPGFLEVETKRDEVAIKRDVDGKAFEMEMAPKPATDRDDAAPRRTAKSGKAEEGGGAGGAAIAAAPPAADVKPTDPALEQWARQKHSRLVKLVADGNCPEAGRLGAEIKDKAPEYYLAHVANDRAVVKCKQYIGNQAKKKAAKDYKSRSQGNVERSPDTTGH
jgi:anti-sigma factor RsiW